MDNGLIYNFKFVTFVHPVARYKQGIYIMRLKWRILESLDRNIHHRNNFFLDRIWTNVFIYDPLIIAEV